MDIELAFVRRGDCDSWANERTSATRWAVVRHVLPLNPIPLPIYRFRVPLGTLQSFPSSLVMKSEHDSGRS
jgi:hypothetical protein